MAIDNHFRFQIYSANLLKTLFLLLFSGVLLILPASAQDWNFIKGYGILPYYPTYGTQGTAASGNTPGARQFAASWTSGGKFYLFGGTGRAASSSGDLNDLWEYDPATNNWRWLKGSNAPNQIGTYGTQGIAAAANTPGARIRAVSWESNGKLYLFGGRGNSANGYSLFNDLWEYDLVTNNWRWLKGSSAHQLGSYGTQGIATAGNTPGARQYAASWTSGGKFYLFGGAGHATTSSWGFNDLWEYDPVTNNWRWLKGSSAINQYGTYGTQGIAATVNTPGERSSAVSWESGGKLYLFGGVGSTATGYGYFNDLWEYDPTTNNWRWLKGSNAVNQGGMYGTQGTAASGNVPAARKGGVSWESNGKLYLFGGNCHVAISSVYFNDLWEYDPTSNNWRWLKGSNSYGPSGQAGIYGTQGTAAAVNTPDARYGACSWESNGKLYLFGGGSVNDLWEYDPATNNWRWLKGNNAPVQAGIYGTQGVAAATNTPGARAGSVSWESNGKLYLFGGSGYSASSSGFLNDLWEYDPTTNNWRWLKGSNSPDQIATYGVQGIAAAANTPGSRYGAASWESNGKLYLFGGFYNDASFLGYYSSQNIEFLNDLWEYDLTTNNWRWLKGSNAPDQIGIYGTQGVAAVANTPGSRYGAVSWESNGKLYLFGGWGYGGFNDLWEYDPSTNNWRWLKGSIAKNQAGTYGTQGIADTANTPGAKDGTASWESNGKLYLFGGSGYSASSSGYLNDLWEYDPTTNNWRWLKGSNALNQAGTYGTQGIAHSTNTPGAREYTVSWVRNGKFYLFGGYGNVVSGTRNYFNDLWEYDLATNNWRWLKGSNASNQSGTLGTQGTPVAVNTPGARYGGVTWESNGQIYLFGGYGYGLDNDIDYRGDLWTAQLPTVSNDVAVSAITSLNSGCSLTNQETITITVKNWGTATQSNIPVSYKINGVPIGSGFVPGPVAQNTSLTYSFTQKADLSAPGTYNIEARTNLSGDAFLYNDISTRTVTNYGYAVPNTPTVTNPGSAALCSGSSVTLTAASTTTGVTYQWFLNGTVISGATSAIYSANAAGSYTVTAIIGGSCTSAPSAATVLTMNSIPPAPTITPSGSITFCSGDSVALTAISPVSGATFTWFKNGNVIAGVTSATYMIKTAGSYTVAVTANGCTGAASIAINVSTLQAPAIPTITQAGFILTSSSTSGNQWYKDNVLIAGATGQKYTVTSNGSYTVIVTDNLCSSQASNAIVISTTGFGSEVNALDVEIHPNPSNGLFIITLPENKSYELIVTDLTGKVISQLTTKDKNTKLNLSKAAKGVYLLKIIGEGKMVVRKLIIV